MSLAETAPPLTAPFFLLGLRSLHAMDARLERILTVFRSLFISRFDGYDPEVFLPILCALAEHCQLNEYVYGCTNEEQGMVDALQTRLDLSAKTDVSMETRIALIACYTDLMLLECADLIEDAGAGSQNEVFRRLVRNTFPSPRRPGPVRRPFLRFRLHKAARSMPFRQPWRNSMKKTHTPAGVTLTCPF